MRLGPRPPEQSRTSGLDGAKRTGEEAKETQRDRASNEVVRRGEAGLARQSRACFSHVEAFRGKGAKGLWLALGSGSVCTVCFPALRATPTSSFPVRRQGKKIAKSVLSPRMLGKHQVQQRWVPVRVWGSGTR